MIKSWKCIKSDIVLTRDRTKLYSFKTSVKYSRTGTLGRQKPESENSLVLNISSETQHQDVGWIHLV